MLRATFELDPPEWAEELARVESTGLPVGPDAVSVRVVPTGPGRVVLEFPERNWGGDVALLVASVLAGEWADAGHARRVRLVAVDWPEGAGLGPTFTAPDRVLVGAIVKPSLGLTPHEFASTAAALVRGGAHLVKDDELLGDQSWCPLGERVRRVMDVVPRGTLYAANVTGSHDGLLHRAELARASGATALMLDVFAQGLDALRLLRAQDYGVPIFAHRVGAAFWSRGEGFGVAGPVVCELTRLLGADLVQVGSFSGSVYEPADEVVEQVRACHKPLNGVAPAVAVLGGGVGPDNAAEHVRRSTRKDGIMVLLGSAAYRHPDGVEAGVRATVEAVRAEVGP